MFALEQRQHFLARGTEQFRDLVNPDRCQIDSFALALFRFHLRQSLFGFDVRLVGAHGLDARFVGAPNLDDLTSRQQTGPGFQFENAIVGGAIPREFVPAVEDGIREAMEGGILAGFSMRDVKVELHDGSYHEVDSSEIAFKIAGSLAFKEAARKAGTVLLEPLMKVEVVVPEDYMGDVIGDVNARRGRIHSMESRPGLQVIQATIPLAELFGYATELRSLTQGRGNYTMHFSHYEEAPKSVTEEVVARVTGTLRR